MSIKGLKKIVGELQRVVDGWSDGVEPSSIEMDMALERVKKIYEMLRFPEAEEECVEEEEVIVEEEVVVEPEEETIEPEEEAIEEIEEPEPIVEVEIAVTVDDEEERKQERRRRILSLYGDNEYVEEPAEPEIEEPQPQQEEELFQSPQPQTYSGETIASKLGFNDRLLLASDLFDGDMESLNSLLEVLERQPSLDDALLYIAEHYSWSGDQDGAKLLYMLLENRYL